MKKAIANRTSRFVAEMDSDFDLSKITMAPKKGTVMRVILMPAIAPRYVEARKIAAAVRSVVSTRKAEANFLKHVAKKIAARKPAAKMAVASKPAAKKIAARKPAAKKAVSSKPAVRKTVASKPAIRRTVASKPAVRKAVARKPAATRLYLNQIVK